MRQTVCVPLVSIFLLVGFSVANGFLFAATTTATRPSVACRYKAKDDENDSSRSVSEQRQKRNSNDQQQRWERLNSITKEKRRRPGGFVNDKNEMTIKKREVLSESEKKRRRLMFVKDRQREKKLAARVSRPLPLDERTPLSALIPGMKHVPGTVISLTDFGAYIDIGTEVDGLLHVSQMHSERGEFVQHPRKKLSPGDRVEVTIRHVYVEGKKLQLTMLPEEEWERERKVNSEEDDRIALSEIQIDDELWGEIRRVTNYGAYIEVGAVVDGFLHFLDHPEYDRYEHPTEFMSKGDRVRVWVSDVDPDRMRIKLTAVRPSHLPGPRRELIV